MVVTKEIITKQKAKNGGNIIKIAVVCANGKAGQLITKEALQRGSENMQAICRPESLSVLRTVRQDLSETDY